MAIKNRDGSMFRLRGPNPLLRTQDIVSESETLVIHNLESLTQEIEEVVYQQQPTSKPLVIESVQEMPPVEQPKPAPKPVQPKPAPVQHKAHNDISKELKPVAYCLPAVEDMRYDMLTGKFNADIRYGERFTFEVVVIEEDLLSCLMWGPLQELAPNSIIYVYDQRRWWKVIATEPHENGLLINCMPSEKNPSFD